MVWYHQTYSTVLAAAVPQQGYLPWAHSDFRSREQN